MAKVFIYSFQRTPTSRATVYYDSDDPTIITFEPSSSSGTPSQPPPDITLASTCQPGTSNLLRYYSIADAPYARYTTTPNSPICGYTPPPCDIQDRGLSVTDETAVDANDGTVSFYATSSRMPIAYQMISEDHTLVFNNFTGVFTNLQPLNYTITATDAFGCFIGRDLTVKAYNETDTNFKYRLQFESVGQSPNVWEVRFYDLLNRYPGAEYPKDLTGGATPLKISQSLDQEDKYSSIAVKTVEIELEFDGQTFTVDEFGLAHRNSWYIEIYKNSEIEFKGYLLPDEIQDYYSDPPYNITLTATDGLPSLKGNKWGDGSDGYRYTTDQIPQFGLKKWGLLIKQCLDQLGYNYGSVSVVSSLEYNQTYNQTLWSEISTWSDLLYGSDGVPNDTYNCLELLLKGMGLTIMQHKGDFKLVNWNTFYYAQNNTVETAYNRSFFQYSPDFLTGGNVIDAPLIQPVGYQYANAPINPPQSLRFDKFYNLKATVDFNLLALLYPNPSFEIGAVEGVLPIGWAKSGSINPYLHYDETAFDGSWEYRIEGASKLLRQSGGQTLPIVQGETGILFMQDNERSTFLSSIYIDQPNKKLNLSFNWRPVKYSDNNNVRPTFSIYFTPDNSTTTYIYSLVQKNGDLNDTGWFVPEHPRSFTTVIDIITDYIAWNSTSITTDVFPFGSTGVVSFGFRTPLENPLTGSDSLISRTIDIDNLQMSISDANEAYTKQVGENHLINSTVKLPDTKEEPLALFTYPNNKRIAGNIFTSDDYATSEVANKWSYSLRSFDQNDRLAATIANGMARLYQRPLRFFEGEVQTRNIDFYGIFTLRFYDGIFIPYSIEYDCKNERANIVIVEIDDSTQQAIYKYVPVYEKSARKNIS